MRKARMRATVVAARRRLNVTARSGAARAAHDPFMKNARVQIRTVGPHDRSELGVDSNLLELTTVARGGEHSFKGDQRRDVDDAFGAVVEREPQSIVVQHLD